MLLVEYNVLDKFQVINEGTKGNKRLKVRGIFQKCDEQNNNGRVYPRKILEKQVKAIQEKIGDRSLVGALDHPANDAIHLSQASHLVTKLWVEKNGQVMGEAEILSTPNGKIVEALIQDGVKIGISSRGLGSVSEGTTGKVVNEDFKLITFDLVSDPSTKGAFPELTESMRENSQRAQEIVSKHRKDRVLMAMLEGKIEAALESIPSGQKTASQIANQVTKTKADKQQLAALSAEEKAEKGSSRPGSKGRKGRASQAASDVLTADAEEGVSIHPGSRSNPHDPNLSRTDPRTGRKRKQQTFKFISQDRNSTSLKDFMVKRLKDVCREGHTFVPIPPEDVRKNTPKKIAAAKKRDAAADAARKADPKTPGRNKRQLKRIENKPQGREKALPDNDPRSPNFPTTPEGIKAHADRSAALGKRLAGKPTPLADKANKGKVSDSTSLKNSIIKSFNTVIENQPQGCEGVPKGRTQSRSEYSGDIVRGKRTPRPKGVKVGDDDGYGKFITQAAVDKARKGKK